ncbi:CheR family methyltransferase [Magnetococcales bacterium HHB-1]
MTSRTPGRSQFTSQHATGAQHQASEQHIDYKNELSEQDFHRLSSYLQQETGLIIPSAKKALLRKEVQKRLHPLGFHSAASYINLVTRSSIQHEEVQFLLFLLTQKPERFFHGPEHYEYLIHETLPELLRTRGCGLQKRLMVWSIGCGLGTEPYTLAMILSEFSKQYPGFNFKFRILATDIAKKSIELAKWAVFSMASVRAIPLALKKQYLLKSKSRVKQRVRVTPSLRKTVKFRQMNLLDPQAVLREKVDIIFCRNTLSQLETSMQQQAIEKICGSGNPGCYLFFGPNEQIRFSGLPIQSLTSSVYQLFHEPEAQTS